MNTIIAYVLAAIALVAIIVIAFRMIGRTNMKLGGVDAVVQQMEKIIELDNRVHVQAGRPVPVGLDDQLRRLRALAKAAPAAWRREVSSDD